MKPLNLQLPGIAEFPEAADDIRWREWPMISVDENLCVGCAMCVPYCPEDAISCYGMVHVNENCIDCLACLEYCPVEALKETVLENRIP